MLRQIVEDYYNDLIAKCPIGKMDLEVSSKSLLFMTFDFHVVAIQSHVPPRLPRASRGEAAAAHREGGPAVQISWCIFLHLL